MTRIPTKPCKKCLHKKGIHAWNPNYTPGGQYKSNATYPCQEEYCTCDNYEEMNYEDKIKVFGYGGYK